MSKVINPSLVASVLALVFACAAAAATPHTERAVSGDWQASFTYLQSTEYGLPSYSDLHLTVLHAGVLVLDAPVTSSAAGSPSLGPGGFGARPSISFRDLDADGLPELLLLLYTGGAHCCFIDQVFDFSTRAPNKSEINFADSGAKLVRLGEKVLFESADERFAYVFTDFADSGAPLALWQYQSERFVNVTREYPASIRADAAFWWKTYRSRLKSSGDVRGFLSAWAADEAMLGVADRAKTTLLQIAFQGTLDNGIGGAKGSTYVRALWKFLGKDGYVH